MKSLALALSLSSLMVQPSDAFYLPGVNPKDYNSGDKVEMKVNHLTSSKTQLPYQYYKLPFCAPDPIVDAAENLGEVLTGDKIQNTLFDIKMKVSEKCKILCRKQYTEKEAKQFVEKIDEEYNVNLLLDGLPAATQVPISNSDVTLKIYEHGYRVGGIIILTSDDGKEKKGTPNQHFLYNHIRITVKYHDVDETTSTARVVGLDIEPFSVRHKYKGKWSDENPPKICQDEIVHNFDGNYPQKIDGPTEVIWTYDIQWEASDIRWASRWDVYLSMNNRYDDEVHWFSIINSLLIVIFLTGMVAMIMLRTLHRDLARYNMTEEEKAEEREESGWKLVHGDVFRPPNWPMLFSITVGTGSQIFFMSFLTLFFSAVGYLSPARRGSLMIAVIVCTILLGIVAGYTSARTYKMFNGTDTRTCTILTALLYPGIIFLIILLLDLVEWAEGSTSAIPFGSFVAIFALWFGISVPLTYLGAYLGYKRDVDELPVAIQSIPRMIPDQPWYLNEFVTTIVGGILPFGAVFVELFFILSSLWLDQFYYVFGFLLIVFFILLITCAEITIVLVYFQLCSEDYRWWWRSIFTSGSSAIYLFIYSAFYYSNKIESEFAVAGFLYFGYMFIISILFFLGTGVVGYYASYWFIVKIFGSIKVD